MAASTITDQLETADEHVAGTELNDPSLRLMLPKHRACSSRWEELRRVAIEQGLMDLSSDGLAKVAPGTTTLAEVACVVV